LCGQLRSLSQSDPTSLKQAAVERQRLRLSSEIGNIADFVSGVPSLTCHNKTALQKDPLEYGNATMAFYQDTDENVYCFTSDMYQSLIETSINPHRAGRIELPERFVDTLKSNLQILKRFGINPSKPVSIVEGIDALSENDSINSVETDYIINSIITTAKVPGINEATLRKITADQMIIILRSIDMEQPLLEELTSSHRFSTFCRAAYMIIKLQPQKAITFFNTMAAASS
jgi:hypothetical protein